MYGLFIQQEREGGHEAKPIQCALLSLSFSSSLFLPCKLNLTEVKSIPPPKGKKNQAYFQKIFFVLFSGSETQDFPNQVK